MMYMKNMVGRSLLILSSLFFCCSTIRPNSFIQLHPQTEEVIRWCDTPQFVAIHPSIPESEYHGERRLLPIENAVEYWNSEVYNIFLYVGILDIDPSKAAILIMDMPEALYDHFDEKSYAVTVTKYDIIGCLKQSVIYIKRHPWILVNEEFETVIRHELGHALGFGHSEILTDLMWKNIEFSQQHPVDLSPNERVLVHSVYP